MGRIVLAILLMLGMAQLAWADCPEVMSPTTRYACTTTVFNDSGGALTSFSIVVWDDADTEWERTGYPYVTTTTTVDDINVAGVLITSSCPDQSLCEMVYKGWTYVRVADASDAFVNNTLVGTSATAGQAGDYTAAANTCALGNALELRDREGGGDANVNNQVFPVNVNIACQ